jgi:hypothetical protein
MVENRVLFNSDCSATKSDITSKGPSTSGHVDGSARSPLPPKADYMNKWHVSCTLFNKKHVSCTSSTINNSSSKINCNLLPCHNVEPSSLYLHVVKIAVSSLRIYFTDKYGMWHLLVIIQKKVESRPMHKLLSRGKTNVVFRWSKYYLELVPFFVSLISDSSVSTESWRSWLPAFPRNWKVW